MLVTVQKKISKIPTAKHTLKKIELNFSGYFIEFFTGNICPITSIENKEIPMNPGIAEKLATSTILLLKF
jgi:hypothetical protein